MFTLCLLQFRENLKDVLKPEHDDHYLLRWLRGLLTSMYEQIITSLVSGMKIIFKIPYIFDSQNDFTNSKLYVRWKGSKLNYM